MYSIAICDDEKFYQQKINDIVSLYIHEHKIIGKIKTFMSSRCLLDEIKEGIKYDIYILDIEMPKNTGLDIVKEIRRDSLETIVIFVTFHLQYMMDSFELDIFRYIPKSLLNERLPIALEAALKRLDNQEHSCYRYSNAKRLEKIFIKDIIYAYKEEKYTVFVLYNQKIKVREPLIEVYKKLPNEYFIKADRCYIVKLQSICKVDNTQGKLILENGIELNVSKIRIQEIKKKVGLFWGEKL